MLVSIRKTSSRKNCLSAFVLGAVSIASVQSFAGEDWDVTAGIQGAVGDYSNSRQRDKKSNYGFFVSADYLESYGFTFVYDNSSYDYRKNSDYKTNYGRSSIDQDAFFLSGRKTFRPDALNGLLTVSFDIHHIDNDDKSKISDNVKVYAPHISYITYDKNYYVDLGYANSDYYKGLTIDQWTPTAGFAFNDQKDWLQMRGYLISSSKRARTQNQKSAKALEVSLTHFFDGQFLNLSKIKGTAITGERFYAVDRDAATVYNLGDVQRGGFSLLAEFDVTESVKLTLSGGNERYRDKTYKDDYSVTYFYTGLSTSW